MVAFEATRPRASLARVRKVSRAVEAHFHSWEGETPDSVSKQRPATVARHVVAMDVEDVEQDPRQQQRNEQKTKTGSGKDMFHVSFSFSFVWENRGLGYAYRYDGLCFLSLSCYHGYLR